jgi:hypothetical protein
MIVDQIERAGSDAMCSDTLIELQYVTSATVTPLSHRIARRSKPVRRRVEWERLAIIILGIPGRNVRYWHLADIDSDVEHVCFQAQSGHA